MKHKAKLLFEFLDDKQNVVSDLNKYFRLRAEYFLTDEISMSEIEEKLTEVYNKYYYNLEGFNIMQRRIIES